MRTLLIFLSVLVLGLFVMPLSVEANSPAINNLIPQDLPEEVCLAASNGAEKHCTAGLLSAAVTAMETFFGTGVSFTDFKNVEAAVESGDQAALKYVLSKNRTPGLASLALNLNYVMLEQRPVSGVVFALDRLETTLVGEPVLAQTASAGDPAPYFPGTGFSFLQPIQSFWGWSVTISYSFMILIIVGVAFALMFRGQIENGVIVVQLQQAIPGIVMAMILIPLSYPISGLFIDVISLSTNVYHDFIFGPAGPGREVYLNGAPEGTTGFNDPSSRGLYADDWRLNIFRFREFIGVNQLSEVTKIRLCSDSDSQGNDNFCSVANSGILTFADTVLRVFFGSTSEALGGLINFLFSLVAIIVSIRVAKRLVVKLVTMMFLPIVSPFIFATLAIPGTGSKNVVTYIKNLAAASLAFIVTYIVMVTTLVLTNEAFFRTIPNLDTYSFRPPLLGDLGALISGAVDGTTSSGLGTSGFLFTLVGAFIFLVLPRILDDIDDRLGIEKSFIPKALKPYIDDAQYSTDYTFRKAVPGLYAAGRSTLNTGWRNTLGLIGRNIGEGKASPFEDSNLDKFKDSRRDQISAIQTQLSDPSTGFLKRAGLNAQLAIARGTGNAAAKFYGDSGTPFTPKKDEGGVKFAIEVSFPDIEGYRMEFTKVTRLFTSKAGRVEGLMVLSVPDKSSSPAGAIIFNNYGSPTDLVIGKLMYAGDPTSKDFFQISIGNPKDAKYDSSRNVIIFTKNTFAGQDKVRVPVVLTHASGGTSGWKVGTYQLTGKTKIMAMVGDNAAGSLNNYSFTIGA